MVRHKWIFLKMQDNKNTSRFFEESISSNDISCTLTVDIADTRARLPWIREDACPASKSNCACCRAICFCSSNTSALYASFASLQERKQKKKLSKSTSKSSEEECSKVKVQADKINMMIWI